jgi:hypothetical protein
MVDVPSTFGGATEERIGETSTFVPEDLPEPGQFLDGHGVLTGEDHVSFHELTRDLFEERGVYDMTFGYNLAQLNLDTRHPDAGYRYAVDAESDQSVLRAEFTPTTAFCPQSDTLTKGSFRAWNGSSETHEYDLVCVRVDEMHQRSAEINGELSELETLYRETGSIAEIGEGRQARSGGGDPDVPF